MLSNEEKKSIKDCDTIFICLEDMMSEESANDYRKSYLTLRNLIKKQSKEIEELKEKNKELKYKVREHICIEAHEQVKQLYISKDKIKSKIEFIKSLNEKLYYEENVIEFLQSLLEKE